MPNLSRLVMLPLLLVPALLQVPRLNAQNKESLLIEPGDLVHVQVFESPELEEHARVTDAGDLPLTLGGSVKVAALTPIEAADAIAVALVRGNYLLNPRVLVTVDQYATQSVSVLGEVHTPGAYPIGTPRSILDVLALAGGLTELADRQLLIERNGTSEKVSYFVSNAPGVELDTAVKIYPGDRIIVPRAGIVYALGDLAKPGGYTMTNNEAKTSVLELIARAGGALPNAAPSHARLIRKSSNGYVEIPLSLNKLQEGKQVDFQLQADDIVYVPFSYMRNFAINAVGLASMVSSAVIYKF